MNELTKHQAHDLLRRIEDSRVFITNHAKDRMAERGVTRVQVLRCLKRGTITEGPYQDLAHGSWKLNVEAYTAGDLLTVVAAVNADENGERIIVVTVMN